ncbi:MAG: type II/IV secretion system protein [Deltaproteobacteria bacterium]|nr:type II/IV secretion system protein [Deltaproteobacteria bacterium]
MDSDDEEIAKDFSTILSSHIKKLFGKKESKYQYLIEKDLLSNTILDKILKKSNKSQTSVEENLLNNYNIKRDTLLKSYSLFYNLPYKDLNGQKPEKNLIKGLRVSYLRRNYFVPFEKDEESISVALYNPLDDELINTIKTIFTNKNIKFHIAFKEDIENHIDFITERDSSSIDYLIKQLEVTSVSDDLENDINEENSIIIKLVNKIIIEAHLKNASDIHIEPDRSKGATSVRIRIDGVLKEFRKIPKHLISAVISRIKIMAEIDISERRRPQDGRISFKNNGLILELRIATSVTNGGVEDVVIRILPPGGVRPLEEIGFSDENLTVFKKLIKKPHGLILVCGPTGSGKTSTLHSALAKINKPDVKIWTAEDPIEISQKGLRQVQANHDIGLNFVTILKSFLRSDPDIIMIGEMRDDETIRTSIEASLTGHLVFSTLHTNSAAESIARLHEREIDPFNFADSLVCILSQRLVRSLCPDCKIPYSPDKTTLEELDIKNNKVIVFYKPNGCNKCSHTGFQDRISIHELLVADDGVKSLIREKATVDKIQEYAVQNRMVTLKEDAVKKILSGVLDVKEVLRIC